MSEAPFIFETGAASDTGCVRDHNEDRFLARPASGVWLVADGMGGHEAGDFASQTIADSVASIGKPSSAPDLQARFMDRIVQAHEAIRQQSVRLGGATVGATLVALLAYDKHFACVWSGDSRIYLLRDNRMVQLTEDHTEVQELLRTGAISPEQAASWPRKNVITRAIGVSSQPRTDEKYGTLRPHDAFLLCSDGLTEHVSDAEMAEALAKYDAQECCDRLVALTLSRGARDNVTVVVMRCLPPQYQAAAEGRSFAGRDSGTWPVDGPLTLPISDKTVPPTGTPTGRLTNITAPADDADLWSVETQ